mmetsp:Transcript_1425/g.2468  ORF Transcript_1425/g.2468 Transcript_1425/m.2468 type:complete len:127 (+) Transcript_1425:3-383(+)
MSSSQRQSRQRQSTTRTSPLVEAMVSGDRAGVGGIVANDMNGLCLISKGNMTTPSSDSNDTGVYTSLTRLASALTPSQTASMNNENVSSPLITIEMEGPSSLLIKEYDGHTVAIKVPNTTKTNAQG